LEKSGAYRASRPLRGPGGGRDRGPTPRLPRLLRCGGVRPL